MRFVTFSLIDKSIGRQLREKRLKRGMTLADVSIKLGVSYQQIQKYEQATTKISAATLYKLAELYEVNIEKFFEKINSETSVYEGQKKLVTGSGGDVGINLLMVEDNPGDEAITRRALKDFDNLNILCVHDGSQALEVLRYKTLCSDFPKPDIIFLDIFIPKRDGLSVLKELKRDMETQDIPIVIITNNISQDLMTKAYRLGAAGYICKSFDFVSFKENIVDCIKYWTKSVVRPSQVRQL